MSYVLQHPDFALGNFINLTPALRWLAEREGAPVPVYFSTDYVLDCFLDCPFIRILHEKPDHDPLFSSAITNPDNTFPDYQHVFNLVTGRKWDPAYHTYVDYPRAIKISSVMLLNGSGSTEEKYVALKDVGRDPYKYAYNEAKDISPCYQVVSCGSYDDLERAPYMVRYSDDACWNNMRKTLALMAGACCVIANDTGLAHAAGAMNKPLLVLWKDTPRERCKNAGTRTEYSYQDHEENIGRFIKKYL